ncbi:hypothetical protein D9M68_174210 [compost metagenome]
MHLSEGMLISPPQFMGGATDVAAHDTLDIWRVVRAQLTVLPPSSVAIHLKSPPARKLGFAADYAFLWPKFNKNRSTFDLHSESLDQGLYSRAGCLADPAVKAALHATCSASSKAALKAL